MNCENCLNFVLIVSWISGNYLSLAISADIISVQPKTKTVTEGNNLTFSCTHSANSTNRTSLNFTWHKFGEHSVLSNSSQLTLVNINRTDSGNYSCTATNGTANWAAVASITVFYLPQLIYKPGNLTVNETLETSLFCNASGNPPPRIQWSLPNGSNIVLTNNEFLTFNNTSKNQHGRYSCKATNDVGNSSIIVMYMNVQYKPAINRTGRLLEIDSWVGHSSTLTCQAEGNPTPKITWSKDRNELSMSESIHIMPKDDKDFGNYTCTAWNALGKDEFHVDVARTDPPQIIYKTGNLTVNETLETSLFCNASGNPPPRIQWNLPNGSIIVIANNEFLTFKNTSKNQHGRYSCKATNDVGNSSIIVMYLNVQYKPAINRTSRLLEIDSWVGHNSKLTCEAEGNPTPKITWSKDRNELSMSENIHIMPKDEKDFGIYTCTALNALGKDEFHVDVVRTAFAPDAPTIVNKNKLINDRSFVLRWTRSTADNGRPILRYLVFCRELYSNSSKEAWKKKDAGINLYYNLTLKWAASYQFAVAAENDQGESKKSKIKSFNVVPEPTIPTAKSTVSTTVTSDSSSKAYVYGGAAGGAVLLLIIIVSIVFCVKRRRNAAPPRHHLTEWNELQSCSPKKSTNNSPRVESEKNTYNTMPQPPRVPSRNESLQKNNVPLTPPRLAIYTNVSCIDEEISDWEFPREQLHIEKYVGKGAFCVVARAHAEGLGTVAVKIPKEKAPESNKKDLLAEYELMKQLQPHPNVIRLMGAVTLSDPVMVMFEYIPYGDLLGFLRRSRGLNDNYYNDPDVEASSSLTSEQLLKFAREIADGMAFLAANKIIHRDLAARNVLVGEEETCKITDFGMARDVQNDDIYRKRTKGRLPVKWTAVESLLYGLCTTKSDVWSYGVVLYEIFTIGGCPYPKIQAHRIPYMIKRDYRMPKPDHLDDEIYALMCECWSNEPDRRPTFESISGTIKRLERCHKEIIYMNVYDDQLYGNVEDWD